MSMNIHHDIPKKQVKFQLQGLLLIAVEQMARDRRVSVEDCLKDIIEHRLVKDGYLPEWWFTRDRHMK